MGTRDCACPNAKYLRSAFKEHPLRAARMGIAKKSDWWGVETNDVDHQRQHATLLENPLNVLLIQCSFKTFAGILIPACSTYLQNCYFAQHIV